jgi:FkbM family methyltransferase
MRKFLLTAAGLAAKLLPNSLKQAIYRSRPLSGWIRRGLNRAAPTGLSEVRIAAGDLAGCTLQLDMQTEKDYWLGTYEPELQAALPELVPPGAVVYDVGANIGYVSLLLARAAGKAGRVFAFEALPENAARLRRNLELNGMQERVQLFAGAVTGQAGPVRFLVHASGGMGKAAGSAGRQDEHYQAEVTVEGIALDEFVYRRGNPPPQVVKMDIEGGEVMALPGMRRVLAEARPVMLMELHGPESATAAWEALRAAGYRICWMRKGFPRVPSLQEMGWKAYIVAWPETKGN